MGHFVFKDQNKIGDDKGIEDGKKSHPLVQTLGRGLDHFQAEEAIIFHGGSDIGDAHPLCHQEAGGSQDQGGEEEEPHLVIADGEQMDKKNCVLRLGVPGNKCAIACDALSSSCHTRRRRLLAGGSKCTKLILIFTLLSVT